jgi:hypothetical protein
VAQVDAGIYGGEVLYTLAETIEELRASGLTTVVAWGLHVDESGDLFYNNPLVVSGGKYVGDQQWPARLAALKHLSPTSVKRLLFSIGGWESPDFANIKKLIDEQGTGPDSVLYRNFAALKKAIPVIDGIDFDEEENYYPDATVAFATMLHELGYAVTFCPYTEEDFWIECLWKLEKVSPGLVSGFNLQCYSGGAGNTPEEWIERVAEKMGPDFNAKAFVWPGLWVKHPAQNPGEETGECPDEIQKKLAGWQSTGIAGAWVWKFDEIREYKNSGMCTAPMTLAAYTQAILKGLG